MEPIITLKDVSKSFGSGNKKVNLLNNINLTIEPYQLVAFRGRSGSGKTTLLNLIGALDSPSSGEIFIEGNPLSKFNEKKRSEFRRKKWDLYSNPLV